MTKTVEFYFDFGSPYSYLAYRALPGIAAARGAQIVWRPMLLGGVFKATGNHSPAEIPAKSKWMDDDMRRWAARYGAPFQRNPHFPINTLTLMRGAVGMQLRAGDFARYVDTVFHAMWAEPRNLGDPEELAAVLRAAGFDAAAFLALVSDAEVKEALKSQTEAAVTRGVFGAPTFFVGKDMFWGQDRLDFVAAALAG
ncbi:MAG TPA: 2-hydroxychromene-2-carboxylate isomerase [Burkholderiales bacterium]|nr:2-hydroxychromene-2-carboxylate isomerase [Burkholderiales bacterium]